jgi:Uma2 family endonuclease
MLVSELYECLNGVLIAMAGISIKHFKITESFSILSRRVTKRNDYIIFSEGTAVYLNNGDYVIPDMFVVTDFAGIEDDGYHGIPTLVVEVLSSNRSRDLVEKYQAYQDYGIPEYWIIDPITKTLTINKLVEGRYTDDAFHVMAEGDVELHIPGVSNLSIKLSEIFAD